VTNIVTTNATTSSDTTTGTTAVTDAVTAVTDALTQGATAVTDALTNATTSTTSTSAPNTVTVYPSPQYYGGGKDGHRYYGRYWDHGCGCDRYASPSYAPQKVVTTQVATVPKGGVDTGDGSFR
jgi:hypothetical protein